MDSFEAHSEWMHHGVLPPDLQQLEQCQPPSLAVSDAFSHHQLAVFDLPASPAVPHGHPASCSGATHLELSDSFAEHTEQRGESLFAPVVSCDADVYTTTPGVLGMFNVPRQGAFSEEHPACLKPHHALFASNKERIKQELEMALRKPAQVTQSHTSSDHSSVSTKANSQGHVKIPGTSTRVSKAKRCRTSQSKRTRAPAKPWTEEEHQRFKESLELYGRNWEKCAQYIGTRRAQLVRSHAQKYLIKLWKLGLPLPKKVAESGRGYTLSGKPLLAESASAKSYLTRISGPAVPLKQTN